MRKMTKKQYYTFFNLRIRFMQTIKEYLVNYVLKEGEELDIRPIYFAFLKSRKNDEPVLQIRYFIKIQPVMDLMDEDDDFGDRVIEIPLLEFERIMGWE